MQGKDKRMSFFVFVVVVVFGTACFVFVIVLLFICLFFVRCVSRIHDSFFVVVRCVSYS